MGLDKKGRIEVIITLSLIPVLFFILYSNFGGAKKKTPVAAPILQPSLPPFLASLQQNTTEKLDAMEWGRDPFMPGSAKSHVEGENGLVLNGIAWDEKAPSAIINNKVVKIGDEVAGNKVMDIQKERVVVSKDGSSYELNLRHKTSR